MKNKETLILETGKCIRTSGGKLKNIKYIFHTPAPYWVEKTEAINKHFLANCIYSVLDAAK